jgi:L-cysteine:1D-myo-inositol 2-amino-2-deoxy-alpha-D-glucopyranoside ligase
VVSRDREAVGPREPRDNLTDMDSWRRVDVPVLPGNGPAPRIHDTASGELVLAAAGPVATLYACGITPYDATHIGHAATYTAWDLLVRAWLDAMPEIPDAREAPGAPPPPARYTVIYVQNVTDVDDPLLERAARDGVDWRELARREIQRYRADMEALRVLPPTHLVGAVEALPVIERFAARLADRSALYDVDEDLYFARSADPEFGTLSGPGTPCGYQPADMAELAAERGGDPGRPGKKDPLDALVWRAERPGEPAWDSRFGPGRPGWHVECAAIATEYLGPVFDVQAGGSDLVFPHHELSASHARVAFQGGSGGARGAREHGPSPGDQGGPGGDRSPRGNTAFARVYAHAGMVSYQGRKMSKSLGNLVFVSRLVAGGVDPMAIRMALLAHHYRSDWEWTEAVLADADARLARWRAAITHTEAAASAGPDVAPSAAAAETLAGVRARMRDDLDAPRALGILDRWADRLLAGAPTRITPADVSGARLVRDAADALLGIRL